MIIVSAVASARDLSFADGSVIYISGLRHLKMSGSFNKKQASKTAGS